MERMILMTEYEFNNLLNRFIDAWMEYQKKGYGNHIVSNDTGEMMKTREEIGGAFMIPWQDVFSCTIVRRKE